MFIVVVLPTSIPNFFTTSCDLISMTYYKEELGPTDVTIQITSCWFPILCDSYDKGSGENAMFCHKQTKQLCFDSQIFSYQKAWVQSLKFFNGDNFVLQKSEMAIVKTIEVVH